MPLFFQNPQQRPHGAVGRRVRQGIPHFGGGRLRSFVDNIHDLPLTPTERVTAFRISHAKILTSFSPMSKTFVLRN